MTVNIKDELYDAGVFHYGSDESSKYEKQLTKYFTREYQAHKGKEKQLINLATGPLALDAEDLADKHYDEGLSFFQNFLDAETMSYTMAYFDEDPALALDSSKTLAEAQTDKFKLLASRMMLNGDERLLNFGCGFGYFESYLLSTFPDIKISSLTHSKDQYGFINERMKKPEDPLSSERFQLFFGEIDNNSTLLGRDSYDVVCSVGLMEQINNIELFFNIISELLVDGGRMFHHLIVSRDLIPQLLDPEKTLIGKYFPGGKVLPFYALQREFAHFSLEDSWFINGMNYWHTLDMWHQNFWDNLVNIYPEKMDTKRVRYWNDYFVLCKAMFYPENGHAYGNGQYLFRKQG